MKDYNLDAGGNKQEPHKESNKDDAQQQEQQRSKSPRGETQEANNDRTEGQAQLTKVRTPKS